MKTFVILAAALVLDATSHPSFPFHKRNVNCLATTLLNAHTPLQRRSEGLEFSYVGDKNPETWNTLPGAETCKTGKLQSPIDFQTEAMLNPDIPIITWADYTNVEFIHTGNTVEVNLIEGQTEKTTLTYASGNQTFVLNQFHFHDPSEHTFLGRAFPMEAHFVFKTEEAEPKAAVFAVLFQFASGEGSGGLLNQIGASLPAVDKPTTLPELKLKQFGEGLNLSAKNDGVYRYEGSLTTPPCSEGILFNVLKTPTGATAFELAEFYMAMPKNARYTQPLNGRVSK
ncbi:hypothetical protein HK099_002583 [Clydaea vesicula]|uniref:carbonic anhydrase n=1 Tax=Clydaea vesicula TaxID=447962 RepID=A0AAD5U5T1_9FUNG|nr:hypothetical protein HK099_002583 [Clydaea vesicula]KAJ3396001.1 hypothetical protein HDU92_004304 [Lobulomyces angularis]